MEEKKLAKEKKYLLAIEKGFKYDQETGKVFGARGNEIIGKVCGYIIFKVRKEKKCYNILGHQFAWYWVNKECVDCLDHINGNKIDNHIYNLRSVTNQQNHFNRTTAKGYSWYKPRNKWRARIKLDGKIIELGNFNSEEDARAAYLKAKEKYHKIN